jgi:hypothetical protein
MSNSSDARIKELETQLAKAAEGLKASEAQRRTLEATVVDLKAQIAGTISAQTPVGLEAFTTSITGLLERSQLSADSRATGAIAATLQSVDVEIRGFVVLQGLVPHVVLPRPGDAVDAGTLSLVRMSFATIPQTAITEAPAKPSTPPGRPAPRPQ